MTQKEKYMLEFDVNRLTAKNLRLKETLALAQDTIRIALNIAGIDPNSLNQFERASAILDVATEYKAIKPFVDGDYIREVDGEFYEPVVWECIDKGDAMTE